MATDVLISFDTTGSMSPCIREVRRRVTESLSKLFNNISDLRVSIIAHGDYCDRPHDFYVENFTDDQDALKRFVENVPNTNGGDSDEYYEYVLNYARGLNWRMGVDNKIMLLIADAQPHQVGYRYGGETYTIDWTNEAKGLGEMGVKIFTVQALGRADRNRFYRNLPHWTGGKHLTLNQFTDAVETIIAVCYYTVGKLDEYKIELESDFKMNRNLSRLFKDLDSEIEIADIASDKSGLIPVSPDRFLMLHVDRNIPIKVFVEEQGIRFRKGRGFYQFTKSEMVQERKEVILVNKLTGDMFTGAEAREYIGLPFGIRGQIRPHYFEDYEVYIQSTSYNRKLVGGTKFLYENEK